MKSLKRFLVNFQTKKPMIPKSATPPATDIPTIEPVLKPLSSSESLAEEELAAAAAELVDDEVSEGVIVTVTFSPSAFVVVTAVGVGVGEVFALV